VSYLRNKLALGTRLRSLNLKSQFSIVDSFRDIRVHIYDFLKFVGALWALEWAWQTASDPDQEYIYFMGAEMSPSLRCKLLTEIIIPSTRK